MKIGKWKKVREKFLKKKAAENNGNLVCVYCGREHLDIGEFDLGNLNKDVWNENLATIDHKIPVASGKNKMERNKIRYMVSNFLVCCKRCNGQKGTISYEEFINKMNNNNGIRRIRTKNSQVRQ